MSVTQLPAQESVPSPFALTQIPPHALRDVWRVMQFDLEHCLTQDPDGLWTEDVFALVKQGHLVLYFGMCRGQYVGFAIVQMLPEADGSHRLHLHYVSGPGFLAEGHDQIVAIARKANCRRVTFRASKDGFSRLTQPLGYRPVATEYELQLRT